MDVNFANISSEDLGSNMNPRYKSSNNIVIVPTVSFIQNKNEEPPAKKQKVETSESVENNSEKVIPNSSTSSNISHENLNVSSSSDSSKENLNEESKKVDVNTTKKEIKVNSWASNYLNSIGMNTKPIKMNLSISKTKISEQLSKAEKVQDDSVKPNIINCSKDNVCPAKDVNKTNTTGSDESGSNLVQNDVYPINDVPKTNATLNTYNNIGSSNTDAPKPLLYQFSALGEPPVNVIQPSKNNPQNIEPLNFNTFNSTNKRKYDEYINPVPDYYNNNYHLNQTVFTPNYYEYTYNIIEQQLFAMEGGPQHHNQSSSGAGINYSHPTSQDIFAENNEYRDFYENSQTNGKNIVSKYDFKDKPIDETKRRSRFNSDSSYSIIDDRHYTSHESFAKSDRQNRDFYENSKTNRKSIDSDNISKNKLKISKARRRSIFGSDSSCSDATFDAREKKYRKTSSKRRRNDSRSPYKKERSRSPKYDKRKHDVRRSSRSESYKKQDYVEPKTSKYTKERHSKEKSKSNYDKEKKTEKEKQYEEKKKSSKTKVPRSRTPEREPNKRPRRDSENFEKKTKPTKITPIKSLIQPKGNLKKQHLKSPSPEPFDLRSILSRANEYHENGTPSNSTDTAMDKLRDKLLVTINQPVNPEPKAIAPSKVKVSEKKSKGKKFKTIQFTIKVLCDDGSSSVSEESGGEVNSGDEPGVQRDLSFLDDFNIDEIVDSLKNTRRNAQKGNNSPRIIEKTVPKIEVENSSANLESSIKTENIKVKEETNQDCIILDESNVENSSVNLEPYIKTENTKVKEETNQDCIILDESNVENSSVILESSIKTENIKVKEGTNEECIILDESNVNIKQKEIDEFDKSNDCVILGTVPKPIKVIEKQYKTQVSRTMKDIKTKQTSSDTNNESNDCVIVDLIKTEKSKVKHENINDSNDCIILEQSVENVKIETDSLDDNKSNDCIIVDLDNTTEIKTEVEIDTVQKYDTKFNKSDDCIIIESVEPIKIELNNNEIERFAVSNMEVNESTVLNKNEGIKIKEAENEHVDSEITSITSNDVSNIPLPSTPNPQESTNDTIQQKSSSLKTWEELTPLTTKEIKQELIDESTNVTQYTMKPIAPIELLHIPPKTGNFQNDAPPLKAKEIKQELIDKNTLVTQDTTESTASKEHSYLRLTNERVQQEIPTPLATKETKEKLIDKNVTQDINESNLLKENIILMSTSAPQELQNKSARPEIPTPLATKDIKQEFTVEISPILQDNNALDELLDIPLPEYTPTINYEQPDIAESNNPSNVKESPLPKLIQEHLIQNDPHDLKAASNENQEETINGASYDSDASTVKLEYDTEDEETDILKEMEDIEIHEATDKEIQLIEKDKETKEKEGVLIEETEERIEKDDLTEETQLIEKEEHIKQQPKVIIEITVPMEVDQECEKTISPKLDDKNVKPNSPIATLDTEPNNPDTETIIPENTNILKTIPEISKEIKQELIEAEPAIPKPKQTPEKEIAKPNQQGAPKTGITELKAKDVPRAEIAINQSEISQKEVAKMEIHKLNKKELQINKVVNPNLKETPSTEITTSSQEQVTNTEIDKSNQKGAPNTEIDKSRPEVSPIKVVKQNAKEISKMEITKSDPKNVPEEEIAKPIQPETSKAVIAKPIQKLSPKKDIIFNPKEAPKSDTIKTSSKIKTEDSERQVMVVKNNEIQLSKFNETKKKLEDRMFEYFHDRHTVTTLIHSGRFSNIYKCHDSKKRNFVVKMIKDQSNRLSLGVEKEQILQELQRDIPRANINTVFMIDSFGIDRYWAFLMEYYPTNLNSFLNRKSKPFTIYQVQELAVQLINALLVLRNNNIVHSDIKPAHILMNDSGKKLKLCGFDNSNHEDRVNLLPNIGTLLYRAPEVIVGYSASFAIDVWSTAVILYEMFTRRRLFSGLYNNTILFNQLCLFGDMPPDMIQRSAFKANHFNGVHFLKRSGLYGLKTQIIHRFHKTPKFYRSIFTSYEFFWGSRTAAEKANDMVKLYGFFKLLEQMLVIDPRKRLTIEFICTDPFITYQL